MRKFEILLLAAGLAMLAVIVRGLDMDFVGTSLSLVGWGFVLILGQETAACLLNTAGWRYAFQPGLSAKIPFMRLLKLRIAGDGLNYLTPSVTMAGEWARAGMLGENHPLSSRLAGVAVAKITQTLALALTSLAAIIWAFLRGVNLSNLGGQLKAGAWLLTGLFLLVIFLEVRASKAGRSEAGRPTDGKKTKWEHIRSMDREMMSFLRGYPLRFTVSVLFFLAAYLWGAFEAYWIARFLGNPVDVPTAVLIEMLSVLMDGIFFAVPGKAGTQEATKMAIFTAMGMSPSLGFAFAIVRHIREIAWAAAGLVLFYHDRRREKTAT
ncbi:MAG: lysylphosphatidylglycerol synthase domain-containing protein [bacterium]